MTESREFLFLIPLLPILGAAFNLAFGRRMAREAAGVIACFFVAASMCLAWYGAWLLYGAHGGLTAITGAFWSGDWFFANEQLAAASLHVSAGLVLDHLSAIFCLVITTIGLLIHVYSTAYMEDDPNLSRYFAYLNLFTGAMLILVLGDSLPVTFVGWEGVGLCSYLLIGFWYDKEAFAFAGRKAFIVNRVGDFGFLLGMFMIFSATSTLHYADLPAHIGALRAPFLDSIFHGSASYATFAGLLLFLGACGKSAQFPLYVWLPDAMAGPTPVSALIHAATMVTAGIYLIARAHVVFAIDPFVPAVIMGVGAFTAFFAATMGMTARPIKKILAYSTVSQLGYMFVGVATANWVAGVFHVVTHAFFKAGLFLAAGAIMHALHHEEDVFKMGGLRKKLPITHACYLVYCLAISGIFPFAGFFSKDAILSAAFAFDVKGVPGWWHGYGELIYGVGLFTAALTAFYMFRSYFLVFWGKFRGDHHTWEHAHEAPPAMTVPLVLLAIGSTVVGFLGLTPIFHGTNLMEHWLSAPNPIELGSVTELSLTAIALTSAAVGFLVAMFFYARGVSPVVESLTRAFKPVYTLLFNKYWVDELYDRAFVRPLRWTAYYLWKIADAFLIDLVLVRGSAKVVDVIGRGLRYVQNGQVQRSLVGVAVGTAGIVLFSTGWTSFHAAHLHASLSGHTVVAQAGAPPALAHRNLEYDFDFGDGTPPLKQSSPVARHRYQTPGPHKLELKVHDPRWNVSSSDSETVVVANSALAGGAR